MRGDGGRLEPQALRPPPPEIIVLPPTDRGHWEEPAELEIVRRHFNAGEYRACVEPIEALFFRRRNTFHQALLMYVVALLQLRLGLVRTPRSLLSQALERWAAYPDWQEGLELPPLREHAERLLRELPEGVHSISAQEVDDVRIPPPVL
jgi:hypothetical protein